MMETIQHFSTHSLLICVYYCKQRSNSLQQNKTNKTESNLANSCPCLCIIKKQWIKMDTLSTIEINSESTINFDLSEIHDERRSCKYHF